ncbi:DMT family transporter [Candidatus Aalborgicola defluviihabitans]|mgnify:FL=1|uniref:DMT family transporter n=1 Tax=Candidatus Aalborgicola defluviihabitans TaxID=3386187 RepID=UPI001EBAB213|nr:DMT family transporter [Burkholderiales bacterium]MBL0244047.1 DMT family transporter [Rhodoferax sp.]
MSHASKAWKLDFVLLAAIWGASFLFMRMGALELGVMATAGLRVGIASIFLLPLLLARGLGPVLRNHWKQVLVVGILNSVIPIACFSYALLSITTGLTSILNATTPLFGAVIAWLWLKDKPNGLRTLGLTIGFVGVALLAWDKASFKPDASGASSGWAVLACLLATLCYGLSASFTKLHLNHVPSLVSATGSQLGATVVLLPLSWWFWPDHAVSTHAWLSVIALGVLCSGVAYIVFFRLIERAGPARALSVTFAIPVFALLYGVVLLGEVITLWMVLCGLVIVVGTGLSSGLLTLRRKP